MDEGSLLRSGSCRPGRTRNVTGHLRKLLSLLGMLLSHIKWKEVSENFEEPCPVSVIAAHLHEALSLKDVMISEQGLHMCVFRTPGLEEWVIQTIQEELAAAGVEPYRRRALMSRQHSRQHSTTLQEPPASS